MDGQIMSEDNDRDLLRLIAMSKGNDRDLLRLIGTKLQCDVLRQPRVTAWLSEMPMEMRSFVENLVTQVTTLDMWLIDIRASFSDEQWQLIERTPVLWMPYMHEVVSLISVGSDNYVCIDIAFPAWNYILCTLLAILIRKASEQVSPSVLRTVMMLEECIVLRAHGLPPAFDSWCSRFHLQEDMKDTEAHEAKLWGVFMDFVLFHELAHLLALENISSQPLGCVANSDSCERLRLAEHEADVTAVKYMRTKYADGRLPYASIAVFYLLFRNSVEKVREACHLEKAIDSCTVNPMKRLQYLLSHCGEEIAEAGTNLGPILDPLPVRSVDAILKEVEQKNSETTDKQVNDIMRAFHKTRP